MLQWMRWAVDQIGKQRVLIHIGRIELNASTNEAMRRRFLNSVDKPPSKLEYQLGAMKQKTVTFKFNQTDTVPADVANMWWMSGAERLGRLSSACCYSKQWKHQPDPPRPLSISTNNNPVVPLTALLRQSYPFEILRSPQPLLNSLPPDS